MDLINKCVITFLGYVISQRGVEMDSSKCQAVTEWPEPTPIKEIQLLLQTSLLQGKPKRLHWTDQLSHSHHSQTP